MEPKQTLINDLTQGSVMRQLIRFTMPLMLTNALQVGYNLVDMFFVGQFAGTDALSAVSIGGQITMMMFFAFLGASMGGQIYVAQKVGAGRRDELNGIIGNTLTLCVIVGLAFMAVIPLAGPILRLIRTPEEVLSDAVDYLVICAAGNVLVALYNGFSGILRGMGDSTRPTIFVAVATAVNIVLDYVFVALLHWGAAGAAWATVIGQSMACFAALGYLTVKREQFGFDFRPASFRPQWRHMSVLLRIGVPVAAKNLFISLSMLFVNAQINGLGVVAVAVTGICAKLQSVMNIVTQSLMDGTSSLVGQNIGSGKTERVSATVWCALLVGTVFCGMLAVLFLLFPQQIFHIFSDDAAVLAQAPVFMQVSALFVMTCAWMCPTIGLINGVGFTMLNMVIAVADGVAARIALSLLFGYTLHMGALGFFLGNGLAGFVSVIGGGAYFLSGRWKKRSMLGGAAEHAG